MTTQKTLVIVASIFAMLCMPLLSADNLAAKPRGIEAQAVEKITDDDVKAAKAKVEKLKKNFDISTDRFTNETTYAHKKIRTRFTKLLISYMPLPIIVNNELFVCLFIFKLEVKEIGSPDTITIMIGDKVTTYNSILSNTSISKDGLSYRTDFIFSDTSLLRQIASHSKEINSDGISIRYSSKRGIYYDFHSKEYSGLWKNQFKGVVEAVTETLELYDALQIIKKGSEQQDGD